MCLHNVLSRAFTRACVVTSTPAATLAPRLACRRRCYNLHLGWHTSHEACPTLADAFTRTSVSDACPLPDDERHIDPWERSRGDRSTVLMSILHVSLRDRATLAPHRPSRRHRVYHSDALAMQLLLAQGEAAKPLNLALFTTHNACALSECALSELCRPGWGRPRRGRPLAAERRERLSCQGENTAIQTCAIILCHLTVPPHSLPSHCAICAIL
jgi:hypothetical protein